MSVFKCKMCGGQLEFDTTQTVATCDSCGTKQTLPRLSSDRRANLYDRANHFRRNNEFDKAMGIYEQVLNEDGTDAEAYWSLVLCRYGIEYVEDPASHKRVPTVNRAQFTSIFDDDNYKSALRYADSRQKAVYEAEANAINEIQKGILEIAQKEDPFDVFICYKETDNNGRRTQDSVLANDLYHQLAGEGFKAFFSRITLEDKLGTAYEPYIFAALNSAKVMVVLGTKPEYFNAVWVKNEWSRYLALIKNGAKKVLIPAYRDMDPYDLPEEFSHLQAQDMGKLGFMQDLIRGIQKLTESTAPAATVKETVVVSGGNSGVAPLLERAFMFLEDGEWGNANEYCERVLDAEPKNAQAYLGKLMAELKVREQDALANLPKPFDDNGMYQKAVRFADDPLREALQGYNAGIRERNEQARLTEAYQAALEKMNAAKTAEEFAAAASMFRELGGFRDAAAKEAECQEKSEISRKDSILMDGKCAQYRNTIKDMERAITLYQSIPGWRDADERLCFCETRLVELKEDEAARQREAEQKAEQKRLAAEQKAEQERLAAEKQAKRNKIIATISAAVVVVGIAVLLLLMKVVIPGNHYSAAENLLVEGETAEAAISFGKIGAYKDARTRSLELWDEIAVRETVATGVYHTVGLKSDGTVVAVGDKDEGRCDVSGWTDVVAVAVGNFHTVGLQSDGTVLAVGVNIHGQCNVSGWTDVVAVAAGGYHTIGLKPDGTVVAVGENDYGQCDVSGWTDIVAIAAGTSHTVGLKSDGTVVAVGDNDKGQCDVSGWTDIVAISAGTSHTVGLKSDGTVVAVGSNRLGQCAVSGWTDIVGISAGDGHTVGLKSDDTVVAVGTNDGQCDVSSWTDIVAILAGHYHTVGLKSDGTVAAVGSNIEGECDVSGWTDIKLPE